MNTSLRVLLFDGNKLGPEWAIQLAGAFVRNNTLTQVSLRDNRLDSKSGKALLNAFTHCPFMMELALTADEVGADVWEAFVKVFNAKRACVSPEDVLEETVTRDWRADILQAYD